VTQFTDSQTALLTIGAIVGFAFGLYLIARGLRGNRK